MENLVTEYQETGPCVLNIDLIEKTWDHRFVLYEYQNQFEFTKFTRRGSSCREIKCTISNEQAQEIIGRLKLERSRVSPALGSWRKEGMSELDMHRKSKK